MLFVPTLAAQMSGVIGGVVFSHNSGGPYARLRVTPTNPDTPFQQVIRAEFGQLTAIWQTGLTQGERDGWQLYADNVKVTNRIGAQVNISGLAMFVRNNTARVQVAIGFQAVAPTIFNLGAFTRPPLENASEATQTVDFSFANAPLTDPWASESGSFLLAYVSRPQNSGIKYFRGPYRFAGAVQGDVVPPTAPLTVSVPFAIVAGQRLFGRAVVIFEDGRYTTAITNTTLVVA